MANVNLSANISATSKPWGIAHQVVFIAASASAVFHPYLTTVSATYPWLHSLTVQAASRLSLKSTSQQVASIAALSHFDLHALVGDAEATCQQIATLTASSRERGYVILTALMKGKLFSVPSAKLLTTAMLSTVAATHSLSASAAAQLLAWGLPGRIIPMAATASAKFNLLGVAASSGSALRSLIAHMSANWKSYATAYEPVIMSAESQVTLTGSMNCGGAQIQSWIGPPTF